MEKMRACYGVQHLADSRLRRSTHGMPATSERITIMRKPRKQTTDRVSSLASDVLAGRKKPTIKEVLTLAASALGQDEKKGPRSPKQPR